MRITIARSDLLTALNVVRPAAARTTLPILTHVAISTFEKSVEFICTNLDLTLRTKVDATVAEKGQTTVRVSLLQELVRSFTGAEVELEQVKNHLNVTCGTSKYRLATLDITEFPPTNRLKDGQEFTVEQTPLHELLHSTSFCAGQDESRYLLCSSLLRLNGNLKAVATDGHRLASMTMEATGLGKKARDILLPRQSVTELLRLLSTDEDAKPVRIVATENAAQFVLGDTVLTTKLIEGNYPNFDQVIPATKGEGVTISRTELLTALQRVMFIDRDSCSLSFRKQILTIKAANNSDTMGFATETLMIPPAPEPVKINFNPRYLVEALQAVADDEVIFHGVVDGPSVFKIASKPWLCVIMPRQPGKEESEGVESEATEIVEEAPETKPAKAKAK